ncbi:MAG: hypothetical protein V1800_11990, partial [Candidatus Latescibacterota bacterium]
MLEPYSTPSTFPVTKVARIIEGKGVSVTKRGAGKKIASAEIVLAAGAAQSSISALTWVQDATPEQQDKAERTRTLIEQGLAWLGDRGFRISDCGLPISPNPQLKRISVQFLEDHDVVLDAVGGILRVDADTVAEVAGDLSVLFGLGFFHAFQFFSGLDEGACLDRTLTLYEQMADADQSALAGILSAPELDSDKVFLRFLR